MSESKESDFKQSQIWIETLPIDSSLKKSIDDAIKATKGFSVRKGTPVRKDIPEDITDESYYVSSKLATKSQNKKGALEVGLITSFTQELAEVFPKEWDEWQHWISDMMESRMRMQSKGMNHRLVSLITFYRLIRFAFHIGIDKVYILAIKRKK
jgi:hypothetical protein